jgi:2-polyprenyl-3-methyl-5-hydroxy-6-metoxy-1,4-benzoquinol methylase
VAGCRAVGRLNAAEANRLLYAELAEQYECELEPPELVEPKVRQVLARAAGREAILDACGGSGNIARVLVELGLRPALVDVSPDLLAIYRAKVGPGIEVHERAIEDFLREDTRRWDVIFFSAALHHLDDYVAVVGMAAERLAEGGS